MISSSPQVLALRDLKFWTGDPARTGEQGDLVIDDHHPAPPHDDVGIKNATTAGFGGQGLAHGVKKESFRPIPRTSSIPASIAPLKYFATQSQAFEYLDEKPPGLGAELR